MFYFRFFISRCSRHKSLSKLRLKIVYYFACFVVSLGYHSEASKGAKKAFVLFYFGIISWLLKKMLLFSLQSWKWFFLLCFIQRKQNNWPVLFVLFCASSPCLLLCPNILTFTISVRLPPGCFSCPCTGHVPFHLSKL